ncbi:MAG: hypothetical protein U0892_09230 [Pirellulales bacterium]
MNLTRVTSFTTDLPATTVLPSLGRLVLRDTLGRRLQAWELTHSKCIIGAGSTCTVRCYLPGIAEHHALMVIGGKQIFLRALADGLTRAGSPVAEFIMKNDEDSLAFELAGHRFEYERPQKPALPIESALPVSVISTDREESESIEPPRLKFALVRAMEKQRRSESEQHAHTSTEASTKSAAMQSDTKIVAETVASPVVSSNAMDTGARPAWLDEALQSVVGPLQAKIDALSEPIEQVQRALRKRVLDRKNKNETKTEADKAKQLAANDLTAAPLQNSDLEKWIDSQQRLQQSVAGQGTRLELVNERVNDILSQIAVLERLVTEENRASAEQAKLPSEWQREWQADIVRLQQETLKIVDDLKQHRDAPHVEQAVEAEWRTNLQSQLSKLQEQIDSLTGKHSSSETRAARMEGLLEEQRTALESMDQRLHAKLSELPTILLAQLPRVVEVPMADAPSPQPSALPDSSYAAPQAEQFVAPYRSYDEQRIEPQASAQGFVETPQWTDSAAERYVTADDSDAEIPTAYAHSDAVVHDRESAARDVDYASETTNASASFSDDEADPVFQAASLPDWWRREESAEQPHGSEVQDAPIHSDSNFELNAEPIATPGLSGSAGIDEGSNYAEDFTYSAEKSPYTDPSDLDHLSAMSAYDRETAEHHSEPDFDSNSPEPAPYSESSYSASSYSASTYAGSEYNSSSTPSLDAPAEATAEQNGFPAAQHSDYESEAYHDESSYNAYSPENIGIGADALTHEADADESDTPTAEKASGTRSSASIMEELRRQFRDTEDDPNDVAEAEAPQTGLNRDLFGRERTPSSPAPSSSLFPAMQPATPSSLGIGTAAGGNTPKAASEEAGEESEESVEDYMRRLLARMRGVSESEVQMPAVQTSEPARNEQRSMRSEATPERVEEESDGPVSESWTAPFDPQSYVPKIAAPEKTKDLNAMRELANTSARSAIQVSARRRHSTALLMKMTISVVGCVAGTALVMINGFRPNVALIATLASFCVGIIWGYDAVVSFKPLLSGGRDSDRDARSSAANIDDDDDDDEEDEDDE